MKTQFQLTLEPALVAHMRCSLIAGSSRGSALTLVEVPSLASQSEALSALTLLPGALILVLFHGTCLVSPLHSPHPEAEANSRRSSHTQQNAFTSILVLVTSSSFLSATTDRSWSFLSAFSWSPLRYADYFISCGFHLFFFFYFLWVQFTPLVPVLRRVF